MGHRRRCSACKSPHVVSINTLLAAQASYTSIAAHLLTLGVAMKRDTISAHHRVCLDSNAQISEGDAVLVGGMARDAKSDAERDFASVVQRKAMELLEKGELRVTATHGLQAQGLMDRRVERAADRDLAFNIARLLSGAIIQTPANVIDVTPYELLAPPEIVGD
jgi:hypothetical protein